MRASILLSVGLLFSSLLSAMPPPGAFAILVEAETVQEAPRTLAVSSVATLTGDETVELASEISARIVALPVPEGSFVRAGTLVVQLDDSVEQAALTQAQVRLALAEQQYERRRTLFKQGTGTSSDRDEALANLKVAEADVALAQARLEKTTITAPFEGFIGLRHHSVGHYATPGELLVRLDKLHPLRADFALPEKWLGRLKPGQTVRFDFPSLAREASGEISAISPVVHEDNHSILIRAHLDNADNTLKPGLFTRASLAFETAPVLTIPYHIILKENDETYVYKVVDGQAMRQVVTLGWQQDDWVVVASGLSPDDVVITSGILKLFPGAKINIKE